MFLIPFLSKDTHSFIQLNYQSSIQALQELANKEEEIVYELSPQTWNADQDYYEGYEDENNSFINTDQDHRLYSQFKYNNYHYPGGEAENHGEANLNQNPEPFNGEF